MKFFIFHKKGMSLLEAIIGIAILALIVVFISKAYKVYTSTNARVEEITSSLEVESMIGDALSKIVGEHLKNVSSNGCNFNSNDGSPDLYNRINTSYPPGSAANKFGLMLIHQSTTDWHKWDPNRNNFNPNLFDNSARYHRNAWNRCKNIYSRPFPGSIKYSYKYNNNAIRFCLFLIPPPSSVKAKGLVKANHVFIEAKYILFDFTGNSDQTCASYNTLPATKRGGRILYTIYWQSDSDAGSRYHFRTNLIQAFEP